MVNWLHRESIGTALVAGAVTMLLVILAMWGVSGQKRVVLSQKAQLQTLTTDLSNLDKILSDEKTYAPAMQSIIASLPKDYSDVAGAVAAIELSAKTNNLPTDLTIDEKAKPETGSLNSLTITMKTSGSYTDIGNFASNLSQLPYHTRIDAMELDGAGGKLTATITIRLYMQ